jgi:hypothetical protein
MLERMFVADRLLDFSHPVTGVNFFAPSQDALEALADPAPQEVAEPSATDTSLKIGSLGPR